MTSSGARPGAAGGDTDLAREDARRDRDSDPGRTDASRADTTARRLLWFGALWLAGVGTVSVVAWVLRSVIVP